MTLVIRWWYKDARWSQLALTVMDAPWGLTIYQEPVPGGVVNLLQSHESHPSPSYRLADERHASQYGLLIRMDVVTVVGIGPFSTVSFRLVICTHLR